MIDLQNSFCSPGGAFDRLGLNYSRLTLPLGNAKLLLDAARKANAPVVLIHYVLNPDYSDGGLITSEILPTLVDMDRFKQIGAMVRGSWDAEFVPSLYQSGDHVIEKTRHSAFIGTELHSLLQSLGVKQLFVGGVTTSVCVESTARDAAQLDYRTFIVEDAAAEQTQERHDATMVTFAYAFGGTLKTTEAIAFFSHGGKALV